MVTSGAKGSMVNHAMISVGLGQQELEVRAPASRLSDCVIARAAEYGVCGRTEQRQG